MHGICPLLLVLALMTGICPGGVGLSVRFLPDSTWYFGSIQLVKILCNRKGFMHGHLSSFSVLALITVICPGVVWSLRTLFMNLV